MTNRELYFRDPTTLELLNNGVSKVSEFGQDTHQIKTLRFELETSVCDGEYARGLGYQGPVALSVADRLRGDTANRGGRCGHGGAGGFHLRPDFHRPPQLRRAGARVLEIIRKQRDGSKDGTLRSSLCALIFLIGKLPRAPGADDGVRANAETLIDLLVSDMKNDRPRLEQQVPTLLKQLVDTGQLMAVDTEFRIQTREGALWTHDFNHRRIAVLADEERINGKRVELLRDGTKQALKPVSLQQGTSHQPRKLVFELSSSRPSSSNDEVTLWMRDGWSDDEKSVLNDARAAGADSPLLFGYLPRLSIHHEELRQAIATLDAHGPAGTPEAIKAQGLFPQELVGRGSHPSRRDRPKPLRLDTAIPGHRPSNSHAA